MREGEIKVILSYKEIDRNYLWLKPRVGECGYDLLYFGCNGWTPLVDRCHTNVSLCGSNDCGCSKAKPDTNQRDTTCPDDYNNECGGCGKQPLTPKYEDNDCGCGKSKHKNTKEVEELEDLCDG